jgi:hypothetical protein
MGWFCHVYNWRLLSVIFDTHHIKLHPQLGPLRVAAISSANNHPGEHDATSGFHLPQLQAKGKKGSGGVISIPRMYRPSKDQHHFMSTLTTQWVMDDPVRGCRFPIVQTLLRLPLDEGVQRLLRQSSGVTGESRHRRLIVLFLQDRICLAVIVA